MRGLRLNSAWRIGSVAGIGIFIHSTFWLLLLYILFIGWREGDGPYRIGFHLALVVLLFGCVGLHELGHALMARRFGVPTRDITMLPIGGLARLERIPERPHQELAIALAGPAVNIGIAVLLLPLLLLITRWLAWESFVPQLLMGLLFLNLFLVAFNLLPAFPMDGGRVLRAALATVLDYLSATRVAVLVGRLLALTFIFVGLFVWSMPMLALAGIFVFFGAGVELQQLTLRQQLSTHRVWEAMVPLPPALDAETPTHAALELIADGPGAMIVEAGGRVAGLLDHRRIRMALAQEGGAVAIGAYAWRNFPVVLPQHTLEQVWQVFSGLECGFLPVVDSHNMLVGIVTPESIRAIVLHPPQR